MAKRRNWARSSAQRLLVARGSAELDPSPSMPTMLLEANLLSFVGRPGVGAAECKFAMSLLHWIAHVGALTPAQERAAHRMLAGHPAPVPQPRAKRGRRARMRRRLERINSSPGVTTYPIVPIEPYSGDDPPWVE